MRPVHLALALGLAACSGPPAAPPAGSPAPAARGVVLISIDALRADSLGPYGAARPTTPFLDRLAERAVVFENAFCEIPSTLPSHLSMFTGLYPTEHGVLPPSGVLSAAIPTLPELLAAGGVRTFGHSEGGYVQGGYGFARGFEEWTDTPYAADTDVERTFRRGLDSLSRLAPGERFFLFLHTYSVHDPFAPPPGYAERFWSGPPPAGAFPPTGPELAAFNRGERAAVAGAANWYRALYDAGVRYLDDVLAGFFADLERSGLAARTTVILTSDHGEEFLEHGRFVHTQLYPECLRVPLVVVPPAASAPRRERALAQLVDLAPTVLDLLGLAVPGGLAGRSLRAELEGSGTAAVTRGRAFGQEEATEVRARTVLRAVDGRLHQLARWSARPEADGFWMGRELTFDAAPPALEFTAVAFARARRVEARAGGERLAALDIGTEWARYRIPLPPGGKRRVTLTADGCDRPRELGRGADERCLSVKLAGTALDRTELYDLAADPLAARDLSAERADLVRTLAGELRHYPEAARAPAVEQELTEEQLRQLRALGYL